MKDTVLSHFIFTKQFSTLCYNVAGLSNKKKRGKIWNKFVYPYKEKGPEILCFQELRFSGCDKTKFTRSLPSYRSYVSLKLDNQHPLNQTQGAPGVSISLHDSLNATILDKRQEPGWLLLLKCRILEKVFIVGTVYLPHGTLPQYAENLKIIDNHLNALKCENVLLMGDFNSPLEDIDSSASCLSYVHKARSKLLNPFLEKRELQDVWRLQNPQKARFSRRQISANSSRIDYIFATLNLSANIFECDIGNSYCSDHSPVTSKFRFSAPGGKRQFYFPVDLCYSDQFKFELKQNLDKIRLENQAANPHTMWELVKATVRSSALRFKGFQSKIRKELVEEYEVKIAQKTYEMDMEEDSLAKCRLNEDIRELNGSLDSLFEEGKALKYASNLARWYKERNKSSAYFLQKFRQNKCKPVISHLITHNGEITDNKQILKEAHTFYSKLYKEEPVFLPQDMLDETPCLSPNDSMIMSQKVTSEELLSALKTMKPSSAPGNDGLTVKFYLHFWDLVKEDLIKSFEHARIVGKLSSSQRQGLIRLLPKKLRNLLLISNWRPITLLNIDYKILTKLFALRMKDMLPFLIHSDQRGFVKGRRISESVLDLFAMVDTILDQDEDYLICTIDIRKAFDSIDWNFLRYVLHLYDFPQDFISWFNIFYSDRTAYITNNNETSDPILIQKGNFQGCPLSPLFFVLAIEILAIRVRNNPEIIGVKLEEFEKKINLVADDILLVFKNSYVGAKQVEEELKEFSINSGLHINKDKCTVSRISKTLNQPDIDTLALFHRQTDFIQYVGLHADFNHSKLWDSNITPIIDKMFAEIKSCSEFSYSTVLGRTNVLKSLFFSRVPYFLEIVVCMGNEQAIKLFQSKLDKVVWNGKKPKMKMSNAVYPTSQGGLGLIDVINRIKAIKIDLLQRAINYDHKQFWQAHLFSFFKAPLEQVIRCNLSYKSMENLLIKPLPLFWEEVMQYWCSSHYVNNASKLSKEEIQEALARPSYFNSAIGQKIPANKRWSDSIIDWCHHHSWRTVADVIQRKENNIPGKGFISRRLARSILHSVPLHWRNTVPSNDTYCIAQKMIDQKFTLRDIYHSIIDKKGDFMPYMLKWENFDCQIDWQKLSSKSKCFVNGNLKNFFLMFNSFSLLLNNSLCHFSEVSKYCSFCKTEVETYEHLFWDCAKIKNLWHYVHSLVGNKYCTKSMSLIPYKAPTNVVVLFTLCKYHIYISRSFHKQPNVYYFKNKLRFHLRAMKATHVQNNNEAQFVKTWGFLYSRLCGNL